MNTRQCTCMHTVYCIPPQCTAVHSSHTLLCTKRRISRSSRVGLVPPAPPRGSPLLRSYAAPMVGPSSLPREGSLVKEEGPAKGPSGDTSGCSQEGSSTGLKLSLRVDPAAEDVRDGGAGGTALGGVLVTLGRPTMLPRSSTLLVTPSTFCPGDEQARLSIVQEVYSIASMFSTKDGTWKSQYTNGQ